LLVRCVSARDDDGVEIGCGYPVDGRVDGDWPVALLASDWLVIEARDGHHRLRLAQAVERVEQFHVLEVISREEECLPSGERHGSDPTLHPAIRLVAVYYTRARIPIAAHRWSAGQAGVVIYR
jgi:hypothetical protein